MSAIISAPASRAVFTISDTTPDSPAAYQSFILLIDSLTMSLSIKQGMLVIVSAWDKLFLFHATLCLKASYDNCSKLFSFDHPLCSLKHIVFLMITLDTVSQTFPFYFLNLARQTVFFTSRYFSLLVFSCFHSFHASYNLTVSAWVMIPPNKPQPNIFFCRPGPKKINKSPKADKKPW